MNTVGGKKAHINLILHINLSASPFLFDKDNPSKQNQKVNKRTNFQITFNTVHLTSIGSYILHIDREAIYTLQSSEKKHCHVLPVRLSDPLYVLPHSITLFILEPYTVYVS